MNRRAILLAASSEEYPSPNVYLDLRNFTSFLRSDPGGSWHEHEIFLGENVSRERVLSEVSAAKDCYYCLVYFAGQGEIVRAGRPWVETSLRLKDGATIMEQELNSGSPRCTLIMDCSCGSQSSNENISTEQLKNDDAYRSISRTQYDQALAAAEGGFVKVYAGALNAPKTSYSFTHRLLHESLAWSMTNHGILNLRDAVSLANSVIGIGNSHDLAEYKAGRRLHHFPFALRI